MGSKKSLSMTSSMYSFVVFVSAAEADSIGDGPMEKAGTDFDFGSPLAIGPLNLASDWLLEWAVVCPLVITFDLFCLVSTFAPSWRAANIRLSDWLARQSVLKKGWSSCSDLRYVKVNKGRPGVSFIIGTSPFNWNQFNESCQAHT